MIALMSLELHISVVILTCFEPRDISSLRRAYLRQASRRGTSVSSCISAPKCLPPNAAQLLPFIGDIVLADCDFGLPRGTNMLAQHHFASLLLIAIDLAEHIQIGLYLYCTATGTSIQYYRSPFYFLQMCKVIRVSSRIV